MLTDSVLSTGVQVGVTGAGLVLAIYALIIPSSRKMFIHKLLHWIYKVRVRILKKPTFEESKLITELQREILKLPNITLQTKSKADMIWIKRRKQLMELVLRDDPRRFLSWDVITDTMFVNYAPYIRQELIDLMKKRDWHSRWKIAIKENNIGMPERHFLYNGSSGNQIHHAYHLAQFEKYADLPIRNLDMIIEFGGGYGNMARMAYKLGFNGKYLIYDLPEFCALQKFFLKSNSLEVANSLIEFDAASKGTYCTSQIDDLYKVSFSDGRILFASNWAISEVELNFRRKILSIPIIDECENYLISYQDIFGEVNNIAFFKEWTHSKEDWKWIHFEIPHLPRHYYLFGKRIVEEN